MIYTRDDETIIAQCTPRGSGAIALLRFSGVNAIAVADAMSKLPQGKRLIDQLTHTIHYGFVVDREGKHLDQVLFLVMRAPATFTGQDTVEITCHNNQFLIESILREAIKHGARSAQEGEFSRRAYLQGKIDLTQAEAIDELIHANSEFALKKSLAQVEGSFSSFVQLLEKQLVKAIAWCEASFEFLDEGGDFVAEIREQLDLLLVQIAELHASFGLQKHIREGIRIACIGSVNVGKSSLFNALLGQSRAIVADVAGTTRDSIESGLYRNGIYWTLIDTAGLRQTDDYIEQAGIERSQSEARQADVIILAFDGSRALTAEETAVYDELIAAHGKKIIPVITKADLPQVCKHPWLLEQAGIAVAHLVGVGIVELLEELDRTVAQLLQAHEAPFLVNKRQFQLLQRLEKNIQATRELCGADVQYELVAQQLKDALESLSELTGKSVSEAALDAVFKEFCVGK